MAIPVCSMLQREAVRGDAIAAFAFPYNGNPPIGRETSPAGETSRKSRSATFRSAVCKCQQRVLNAFVDFTLNLGCQINFIKFLLRPEFIRFLHLGHGKAKAASA